MNKQNKFYMSSLWKFYINFFISLQHSYEVNAMAFNWHVKKLRQRVVKFIALAHTLNKGLSWDMDSFLSDSKSQVLMHLSTNFTYVYIHVTIIQIKIYFKKCTYDCSPSYTYAHTHPHTASILGITLKLWYKQTENRSTTIWSTAKTMLFSWLQKRKVFKVSLKFDAERLLLHF